MNIFKRIVDGIFPGELNCIAYSRPKQTKEQKEYVKRTGRAWPDCEACHGTGIEENGNIQMPCTVCLEGIR